MSRRVFLVGEGPADIGGLSKEGAGLQTDDPGFLQPIVRRLLRGGSEFGAAIRRVCKLKQAVTIPRPPEELWGAAHQPASRHPKSVLRRVIGAELDSGMLAQIGEQARLKTIRENCPASFEPFAAELEAVGPPASGSSC